MRGGESIGKYARRRLSKGYREVTFNGGPCTRMYASASLNAQRVPHISESEDTLEVRLRRVNGGETTARVSKHCNRAKEVNRIL